MRTGYCIVHGVLVVDCLQVRGRRGCRAGAHVICVVEGVARLRCGQVTLFSLRWMGRGLGLRR